MVSNRTFPVSRIIDLSMTRGTMTARMVAYIIDLVVIMVLTGLFYLVVGVLGLVTFGLAWFAFAIPGVVIGVLYSTLTVSSYGQGTYGMRSVGIRLLDARTGGTVPPLYAAVHALLFYCAIASGMLLLVVDVAIGFFRSDSRLGHDLITSIIAVRS